MKAEKLWFIVLLLYKGPVIYLKTQFSFVVLDEVFDVSELYVVNPDEINED